MIELATLLPLLNVLIIPALVYVVRIDRRMGQIDALSTINQGRIDRLEVRAERQAEDIVRLTYRVPV